MTPLTRRKELSGSLVALAVMLTIPLWSLLSGNATAFHGDTSAHYAPQKALQAQMLKAGIPPTWDPFLNLGEPMVGNPALGTFYPPTVLPHLFLPVGWALSLSLVFHILLLGIGAWVCVVRNTQRGWAGAVGGLACGLSGVALSYTTNPQYLFTLAWLPWAWVLAEHAGATARYIPAIAAGCALGFAVHGGDAQGALVLAGLTALATTWKARTCGNGIGRGLQLTALTALVAIGISAAIALPAMDVLSASRRGTGLALDEAVAWSFHPVRLVTWIMPEFFGLPAPVNSFWGHDLVHGLNNTRFWFYSVYIGLAALAGLTVVHARNVPLVSAAVVLLLLALGMHLPLYASLHEHLPVFSAFRYPEKYLGPAVILFALAGASGLAHGSAAKRLLAVSLFAGIVAAALFWGPPGSIVAWIQESTLAPNADAATIEMRADGARTLQAVMLILTALFACRGARRRWLLPALFVASSIDLVPRATRLIWTVDRSLLEAPTEIGLTLKGELDFEKRPVRIVRDAAALDPYPWPRNLDGERMVYSRWRSSLKPDFGLLEGFSHPSGYSGLEIPDIQGLGRILSTSPAVAAGRIGARWVVAPPSAIGRSKGINADIANDRLTRETRLDRSGLDLFSVRDVLSEVSFASAVRFGTGGAPLLEDWEAGGGPVGPTVVDTTMVLLGGKAGDPGAAPLSALVDGVNPDTTAVEEQWKPATQVVSFAASDQTRLLVQRDRFAEGWSATTNDGTELPIYRVDGFMRGVAVEPGVTEITFRYRTGEAAAAATLFVALSALLIFVGTGRGRSGEH